MSFGCERDQLNTWNLDQHAKQWSATTTQGIGNGDLLCVKTGVPLTEAVSLLPCGHKVQETAGKIILESKENCPLPSCNKPVQDFLVNYYTRSLVKGILENDRKDNEKEDLTAYVKNQNLLDTHAAQWDKDTRKGIKNGNLLCVKTGVPLTEAVNIWPCGHKVQEDVGKSLLESNGICPFSLCGQPVTGYEPNLYTRKIAKLSLEKNNSTKF